MHLKKQTFCRGLVQLEYVLSDIDIRLVSLGFKDKLSSTWKGLACGSKWAPNHWDDTISIFVKMQILSHLNGSAPRLT